jgi:hypothetical protein
MKILVITGMDRDIYTEGVRVANYPDDVSEQYIVLDTMECLGLSDTGKYTLGSLIEEISSDVGRQVNAWIEEGH